MAGAGAALMAHGSRVKLAALAEGNPLSVPLAELAGANVLIRTSTQLHAALTLVALDGIAARLVIAPPDLKDEYMDDVIARAGIDTLVSDGEGRPGLRHVRVSAELAPPAEAPRTHDTQWVMFTSGTTGAPKMVAHSLTGLTGAIGPRNDHGKIVWGTFYDIRRYGGLQILLRALMGATSLVLSEPGEAAADFLARLGEAHITHQIGRAHV